MKERVKVAINSQKRVSNKRGAGASERPQHRFLFTLYQNDIRQCLTVTCESDIRYAVYTIIHGVLEPHLTLSPNAQ